MLNHFFRLQPEFNQHDVTYSTVRYVLICNEALRIIVFQHHGMGFTMFSIAELLERAKAGGHIESDYRLAKVIGITHSAVSNYRVGKTMPDERVLEQLCALSGDDVAVFAAQIQAERARTPEGKTMWRMIAARLAGGVSTAILSVLFTIGLIALPADNARASGLNDQKTSFIDLLYIVSITKLSVWATVRLRSLSPGAVRGWWFLLQ